MDCVLFEISNCLNNENIPLESFVKSRFCQPRAWTVSYSKRPQASPRMEYINHKKIGIVPCYRILQSPRVFPQSTVHGKTSDTFASVNELTIFTFVELPRAVVASVHTIFNVLRLPQRNDNFHGLLSLLSYASEIHGYVISFK